MKLKTALQLLRCSLDDLYFTAVECELDGVTHGANVKKNDCTFANHIELIGTANDVKEFFARCAR